MKVKMKVVRKTPGGDALGLTFRDLHREGAVGDGLPSEGDVDVVRALHHGLIGAAEHIVTFVLQHDLYCVPATLRVNNDHSNITLSSTWGNNVMAYGNQKMKMWHYLSFQNLI